MTELLKTMLARLRYGVSAACQVSEAAGVHMLCYWLCPLCTHSQAAASSPHDVVCLAAGVPITFDFHHHRFCKGGLTEEQAFKAAIATWPKGVRPQVTDFGNIYLLMFSKQAGALLIVTSDQAVVKAMCKEGASDCHASMGLHVVHLIPSLAWL